jgi:hypothetical protein
LRQKGRGRAAGWSPANDGDIVHVGLHLVFMIANSSGFGRANAPHYPSRRTAAAAVICANLSSKT